MNGNTALTTNDYFAIKVTPSADTKVKYNVIVRPSKFTESTTATFSIGIK